MYNTLNTNNITSNIILDQNNDVLSFGTNAESTFNKYSLLLNTLTKSPSLTNGTLNPTYSVVNLSQNPAQHVLTTSKDLTLISNDLETFNIDNLEIITNFNNSLSSTKPEFQFFNTNSYSTNLNNTGLTFNFKKDSNKLNFTLNNSFLNSDKKLLSDIYIFMLLNK